MRTPVCATLGWELDSPGVAVLEVADTLALSHVDVLFLAVDEVSQLWARAVGHPVRRFRSAAWERQAWGQLLTLIRQLRRLLARGGQLVCRLDLPTSRCHVGLRPRDERFPPGSDLNAYEALATVHRSLGGLQAAEPLTDGDFLPVENDHVAAAYLTEFVDQLRPVMGLARPAESRPLAVSSSGASVAWAWEQIVCLPIAPGADPKRMGDVLRFIAEGLCQSSKDPAGMRDGKVTLQRQSLPGLEALSRREHELERQILELDGERDRLRRERLAREELWRVESAAPAADLRSATLRALEVLGVPIAGREHATGLWLDAGIETLPGVLGDSAGRLLRGKLKMSNGHIRPFAFHATEISAKAPGKPQKLPKPLIDGSKRRGETLVPLTELLEAASVVLLSPSDEPFVARIRRSLVECQGMYRFDVEQVVDLEERKTLTEQDE